MLLWPGARVMMVMVSSLKHTASLVVWGCQARHLTGALERSRMVENSLTSSTGESFRWGKMLEWKEERREWSDSRTEERLEVMRSVSSVRASLYRVLRLRPSLTTLSPPSLGRKREEGSVVLAAA